MGEPAYRKLIAWQKAHDNALKMIELVEKIDFKYSRIVVQCTNSATSIGANIAEENAVNSVNKKRSYFEIALSSSYEFDNRVQILKDSKSIRADKDVLKAIEEQNIEVIKILSKLLLNLSF
jgi:four helix bundle protein